MRLMWFQDVDSIAIGYRLYLYYVIWADASILAMTLRMADYFVKAQVENHSH